MLGIVDDGWDSAKPRHCTENKIVIYSYSKSAWGNARAKKDTF